MNQYKGTIYLIQPAELVGTKRYKIGCSAKNDLDRCKKGYKKGTRFMDIRECDYPFVLEQEVKNVFNSKFILIAGKEYFEGNEADIKKEFNDVVSKFTLKNENDLSVKETIIHLNMNTESGKNNDSILKAEQIKLEKHRNIKAFKNVVNSKHVRISIDKNRPKTFDNVFLRDTILHHNKCGIDEYVLWVNDRKHFRRCNVDKSFKNNETFITINAFTRKNYEEKNKTREKPRTTRNNAFLETFFLNDNGVWNSCDELIENKIATK